MKREGENMRKYIIGLFVLFVLFFSFNSNVDANVKLTSVSQINQDIYYNYVVRGNTFYYSNYYGTHLYDLNTGTQLRLDKTYDQLLDVSSDEAWTVQRLKDENKISIHNRFGERVIDIRKLKYNNIEYTLGYSIQAKFLPNTSTLVIATDNNLIFYDVQTQSTSLIRGINTN